MRFMYLRSRRLVLLLCCAVVASMLLVGTSPVLSATDKLELKKLSDEVFWEGVVIQSARVLNDRLCHVVDPCYEYQLAVPQARGFASASRRCFRRSGPFGRGPTLSPIHQR